MKNTLNLLCKKLLVIAIPIFLWSNLATAQNNDPVLFTIEDVDVHQSEFEYIYTKNNAADADYSKKSLEEYLDLYVNFKLKVQKAKELKLDELPMLQRELQTYKNQLADTYMSDNKVKDELLKEAYERSKWEMEIKHIFVINRASEKGTTNESIALKRVNNIYDELKSGKISFDEMVRTRSEDINTRESGGYIGFVKSVLPKGYYDFENALYNLEVGEFSKPVLTPRGYHIVKLLSKRKAKPEIEIAHILLKDHKLDKNNEISTERINKIYKELQSGGNFEQLAIKNSQDSKTATRRGYIGFVSAGDYDKEFEDAAYALENGAFSEPVKSRVGWHIIKKISTREQLSFNLDRKRLEDVVKKTERFDLARTALVERIKIESGLQINQAAKAELFKQLDTSILSYKWQGFVQEEDKKLLTFTDDNEQVVQSEFTQYLLKNARERIQLKRFGLEKLKVKMFDQFVNEKLIAHEKKRLSEKYEDFRGIVREYEEGILLFEITKQEVWDKASTDSVGLNQFFLANKEKYYYDERADVDIYTLRRMTADQMKKVRKAAKKVKAPVLINQFPKLKGKLTYINEMVEKKDITKEPIVWKKKKISELFPTKQSDVFKLYKTNSIVPGAAKPIEQCRGFVIADYQDKLEKTWLKSLKEQYKVKVNQAVLSQMIRSEN